MQDLHKKQQLIMEYLLDHQGGATTDELANFIKVTKTAAKEHIIKLETAGYLKFIDKKEGVGRPKRYYLLTDDGHEAFPRKYSWLSNHLLNFLVNDLGGKAVTKLMEALAVEVARPMRERFINAKTSAEVLIIAKEILNELGFRTLLKQTDIRKGAILEVSNCIYHSVAKEHPSLCSFDIKFIEEITGYKDVTLEKCITKGDAICRFCVKNKD